MLIKIGLFSLTCIAAPCLADTLREAVIAQSIQQHNADVQSGSFQATRAIAQQSKMIVAPVTPASFSRGVASNMAAPSTNSTIGASPTGPVPQDPPKKIAHPQKKH